MSETPATINAWASETFGAPRNRASIAARANREMAELLQKLADDDDDPGALEEAADVIICLFRMSDDIMVEVNRKMAINRSRQWAVGAHGHGQHIPESHDA